MGSKACIYKLDRALAVPYHRLNNKIRIFYIIYSLIISYIKNNQDVIFFIHQRTQKYFKD